MRSCWAPIVLIPAALMLQTRRSVCLVGLCLFCDLGVGVSADGCGGVLAVRGMGVKGFGLWCKVGCLGWLDVMNGLTVRIR